MADEHRSHPPTERRLARLWSAGATPASRALVGVAVLATGWGLLMTLGPVAIDWCAELVRQGLSHGADPDAVPSAAGRLVLRAGLMIGVVSAIPLTVALLAQVVQRGPVPAGSAFTLPAERAGSSARSFDGLRAMRAILMAALAGAAVAAVVRGALAAAPDLLGTEDLGGAAIDLLAAIGWPLLLVLIGAALLDALLGRAAWRRGAWMTHRELEEELRESEGHPLNRERLQKMRRGR